MRRKAIRLGAAALLIATATLLYLHLPSSEAQSVLNSAPLAAPPAPGPVPMRTSYRQNIPADVVYRLFLRHVATFNERADALDKQGKDGSHIRQGLMNKFSLDSATFGTVSQVAANLKEQLAENEAQVHTVIAAWRASYFTPDGKLLLGLSPPPPPPELKQLGQQRRELTLDAMEQLRESLGDDAYFALDQQVRSRVASSIVKINPGSSPQH